MLRLQLSLEFSFFLSLLLACLLTHLLSFFLSVSGNMNNDMSDNVYHLNTYFCDVLLLKLSIEFSVRLSVCPSFFLPYMKTSTQLFTLSDHL